MNDMQSAAVFAQMNDARGNEVCWAIASADGRHAWVTNFGDGTISHYRVGDEGRLEAIGSANGLPGTVAGLAAV